MIIEQQWQDALLEFGDRAFERFDGVTCNDDVEYYIGVGDNMELKPIYELFEHDVKIYGDNAYLMWEYARISGCWRCLSSNKDFNFYNVVIPEDFKLPKGLKFGRHVVGKAKRDGNIFVLSELKIIYDTKNSVRPDKSSSSKGELSERRDVGTSSSQLDVPT